MFELFFLGTGASVPSRDRGLPCVALRRGRDVVLFDCGEGTQRQIMVSPVSFMKVRAILVTHLHGDHFYGLPGLLQTMGLMDRKDPLVVAGPPGFAAALKASLESCEGDIPYELDVREVAPGDTLRIGELSVDVFATSHGIESRGFVVREPDTVGRVDPEKARAFGLHSEEIRRIVAGGTSRGHTMDEIAAPDLKGLSVGYTGDTTPCGTMDEGLAGVDAIVTESTYSADDGKLAVAHNHSTCADAASMAVRCGARALFLVHISNRYKDRAPIAEQARSIFPATYLPDDFDRYELTRGAVRKVEERPGERFPDSDELEDVGLGDHADELPLPRDEDGGVVAHHGRDRGYGRVLGHQWEGLLHDRGHGGVLEVLHGLPAADEVEDAPLRDAADRGVVLEDRELGEPSGPHELGGDPDLVGALDADDVRGGHIRRGDVLAAALGHVVEGLEELDDAGVAGLDASPLDLRDGALADA